MLINFRPVCEHKLKDPARTFLYRTGDLQGLTNEDIIKITNVYGVTNFLDLRSQSEVKQSALNSLLTNNFHTHHFPMVDDDHYLRKKRFPNAIDYFHYSIHLLENNKEAIRELLKYMNGMGDSKLMFGCYAGKDRTGIVSILLLYLNNFQVNDITLDYTLSGKYLKENIDYFKHVWERKQLTREQYIKRLTPHPDTAGLILKHMDNVYGGKSGYLSYLNLTQADISHLSASIKQYYAIT